MGTIVQKVGGLVWVDCPCPRSSAAENPVRLSSPSCVFQASSKHGYHSQSPQKYCVWKRSPKIKSTYAVRVRWTRRDRTRVTTKRDPEAVPAAHPRPCPPSLCRPRPAPANTPSRLTAPTTCAGTRQTPTSFPRSDHRATSFDSRVGVFRCGLVRILVGRLTASLGTRRDPGLSQHPTTPPRRSPQTTRTYVSTFLPNSFLKPHITYSRM